MMNEKFADKVLTDSQMESVAGGTLAETRADAKVLAEKLGVHYQTNASCYLSLKVTYLWDRVGIEYKYSYDGTNKYYLKGSQITRQQALKVLDEYVKNPH